MINPLLLYLLRDGAGDKDADRLLDRDRDRDRDAELDLFQIVRHNCYMG